MLWSTENKMDDSLVQDCLKDPTLLPTLEAVIRPADHRIKFLEIFQDLITDSEFGNDQLRGPQEAQATSSSSGDSNSSKTHSVGGASFTSKSSSASSSPGTLDSVSPTIKLPSLPDIVPNNSVVPASAKNVSPEFASQNNGQRSKRVTTGIHNEGNIHATTVITIITDGDNNIVSPKIISSKSKPPARVEFNVQDCIPSFTGREDTLKNLHKTIEHNKLNGEPTVLSQTKVISGMGGVGKSETVRKYIQLYKQCYGHILWINSETYSEARSCFIKIAGIIFVSLKDLEGKQKEDHFIIEEIYDFVCQKPSLVVFDNAQALETHDEEDGIRMLLPKTIKTKWKHPAIIVTTRNRKWNNVTIIELECFSVTECYSLLKSQLKFSDSEENHLLAKEITELCEGLPLVVQQVIAVIKEETENREAFCKAPYSMQDFVTEVKEKRQVYIKTKPSDSSIGNSVFTIFQITFERLARSDHGGLAVECLDLMSLLNPDNIPVDLLRCLLSQPNEGNLGKALNLLDKYSLLKRCDGFYKIHRMIQAVKIESNNTNGNSVLRKQLKNVMKTFGKYLQVTPITSGNILDILENGVRLTKHTPPDIDKNVWLEFLGTLADRLFETGKYADAHSILTEILNHRTCAQGPDHPDTLSTKNSLTRVLAKQGKFAEAETLFDQVLLARQRVLGPQNPATMNSKCDLASVYSDQGKYDQAELQFKDILECQQTLLGHDHADTMSTKNNLAVVFDSQGKYEQAEKLYVDVLEKQQKILGRDHPQTLVTMNNLAHTYNTLGKYNEAAELYEDVLESRKRVLGVNHPLTMTTRHNIADVFNNQGKFVEAEQLFREVLKTQEQILGPNHPDTLLTKYNLAKVFESQEKNGKAEETYLDVLKNREVVLGPTHPDTLSTKHNLALLLVKEEKFEEAEEFYQHVLNHWETSLGLNHPKVLTVKHNLGFLYDKQGKYLEAEELYKDSIANREVILGKNHSEVLRGQNNLASLYVKLGKYEEAYSLFETVIKFQEEALGKTHADTVTTRNNLAYTCDKLGKHNQAEELLKDVAENYGSIFGQDHPITLTSQNDLAYALYQQGKYEEAEGIFRSVFQTQQRALGERHVDTLTSKHNLAEVLKKQGKSMLENETL